MRCGAHLGPGAKQPFEVDMALATILAHAKRATAPAAKINRPAAFRRRLYDHDVVPEAKATRLL
jgi:hypothetical protein